MASALMVGDELDSGQLQAPYGFLRDGSSLPPAQPSPWQQAPALRQWVMRRMPGLLAHLGLLQNDDPAPPSPPQVR
jgi:hypothetical protein